MKSDASPLIFSRMPLFGPVMFGWGGGKGCVRRGGRCFRVDGLLHAEERSFLCFLLLTDATTVTAFHRLPFSACLMFCSVPCPMSCAERTRSMWHRALQATPARPFRRSLLYRFALAYLFVLPLNPVRLRFEGGVHSARKDQLLHLLHDGRMGLREAKGHRAPSILCH